MDKIRFTKVENVDQIAFIESLAREIWQEHYTSILKPGQAEYMIDKFQSAKAIMDQISEGYLYYLIVNSESEHVGYLSAQVQGEKLFLSKVYLKASARGKGLGRKSVNFIEEIARENECVMIWLTVWKGNVGSIKAYEGCGFKIVGDYFLDIGGGFFMDDHRMEKPSDFYDNQNK